MEANIRAAAENRFNPETFIIARTDAREVFDLDEALRRGERYIRAGADGLFIEAPVNVDELERIGRAFDVPQLANMLEGGRTPFLTPADLEQPGFRLAIYGISLLTHAAQAMQRVLTGLAHGKIDFAGKGVGFEEYKSIVGFEHWAALEGKYQPPPARLADSKQIQTQSVASLMYPFRRKAESALPFGTAASSQPITITTASNHRANSPPPRKAVLLAS